MPSSTQPNILVIWGDDIGVYNVSAYHRGLMGGSTPNIDRIAHEGVIFTDHYAQQSCTAGRASFIMGQHPFRTGMLTIGMPGSKQGIQPGDITIAQALKPLGYMTAQIGKNHLGDRNEFLPTVHGFDEFYGNLYHLNSEEEPEDPDYPKDPEFHKKFGPRGVLKCWATDKDDATEDPRWGRVGRQRIEDTGSLDTKRMETVEDDLLKTSLDFIDRAHKAGKPFFLWHSSTRCHVWTHLSDKWKNKTGFGLYADGMAELDYVVGGLLKKLDDLGIADNTIVLFSTDNGAEVVSWPDGGNTPFKGEKGTTWEGGFRVPCVARWPARWPKGRVINDIFSQGGLVPDAAGRGRRSGRDGEAQERLEGGRQDLQGAPRWLRPERAVVREGRREAQGGLLLRLRRQSQRGALLELEDSLLPDGRRYHPGVSQDAVLARRRQPPPGPLRALRVRVANVPALDGGQAVDVPAGAADRRAVPGHLQGVPAEPEVGQPERRPGAGEAGGPAIEELDPADVSTVLNTRSPRRTGSRGQ
jgi:arylsulfatase